MKDLKWIAIGSLIGIFLLLGNYLFESEQVLIKNFFYNLIPHEKKILTIGRPNYSISLDPATVIDIESFRVTVNIYENLVCYDKNGISIKPCLAENWSVSEDGLVWEFRIKKNVSFHDGTPLDADAVVFNFNRWMDSHNPYHSGQFTYWNMNFEGFPGIVESVQALSSDTVQIKLNKPYAPFLSTLAMPSFSIASPDAIIKYNEDLKYKPIGTGPFVFKSWEKNGNIILDCNYKYWGDIPKINKVVFKTIPNSNERMRQLKSGEILIVDDLNSNEISKLQDNQDIVLLRRTFFNIGYLAMNMNDPNLKIRFVRRAIAYLIDQKKMLEVAFDDSAKIASTFIPPVLWGYNETIEPTSYDVEYAKFLLDNIGLSNGFKVRLLVMDEPRNYFPKPLELAEFVKESLAAANIEVEIDIRPWEEVVKAGQNGDYDMILAGWNGDVADPDNFLYTFFSSENSKKGIVSNYSFYNNAQVDSLLTLARQATDKSFRILLYREIQKIIYTDAPAIPLVHTIPTIGINKSVKNYTTNINCIEPLNNVEIIKE